MIFFRAANVINRGTAQWLSLLLLLGIFLGSLPLAFHTQARQANLVYCPLQKKLVAPNEPAALAQREPLAELCAPQSSKSDFLLASARKLRLSKISLNEWQNEELFFSYAQKGDAAFAALNGSGNLPESLFTEASNIEKTTASYQSDFGKRAVAAVIVGQLPRPPPAEVSVEIYHSQNATELSSVSWRIKPRAPPARS